MGDVWANVADPSPWNEKDWVIDGKVPAELAKNHFNGSIENWADWKIWHAITY